ncbi:TIGR03936 family radical SAM-associated protein [Actinopolymorpha sp. B11F2]|uniref:TIGR03936 family radical SAM-associated protein n=1 Tax=Actinopolymorpha sp. B11F2 TaxID=3160862 RepID=UPI0032E3D4FA
MSRKPTPPDRHTPATVQRLRLRYAKRGRLRFTSHRDFQRALERALRRAAVPMAFSAGFSPHPKISFAGAAPTGAASEAEYAELGLAVVQDPEAVRIALDAALPDGLDVLEIVEARGQSLAERLQASHWRIEVPVAEMDGLAAAVEAFLARETVEVERLTKNGRKVFDIRPAILRLLVADPPHDPEAVAAAPGEVARAVSGSPQPVGYQVSSQACAILQVVVRHGTPAVRPDDVLSGLRLASGFELSTSPRATRLAQGPWDEVSGTVGDPLALDRDAPVTPKVTEAVPR